MSDYEEARLDIFDYLIRFYNNKRIHDAISHLTPNKFERNLLMHRKKVSYFVSHLLTSIHNN
ncbi:IS3 family transposase [Pediococcus argentinicus]|uniref:IS3 family transposase n=1 Tax=Pediococcus argentinicus TaxID=480391 RepID=UPI0035307F4B